MDPDSRPVPASAGIPAQNVDVIIADPAWRRMVAAPERLVTRAIIAAGGAGTVLLTSDRELRRLNHRHRGRNKPTNVLTFETGDIAIAAGTVRREAAAAHRSPAHHLAHLVIHGALHLQGLDHHHPGDARRMEMAETRLLKGIGVANPWRPRTKAHE